MKVKLKIVDLFSISFILFTVLLLFIFRSLPITRIWDNYNVLYVEKSLSETQVLSFLSDAGCKDVISLSLQRIPFSASFTPVEPALSSYLRERTAYFSDENSLYNLFYIPSNYERNSLQALELIKKEKSVEAGLDGTEQYPWLVPIIVLITFIVLLYFSEKKLVFMFPALFFVLFAFSMPFYPLAAFACLDLLALIFINHIWERRKYLSAIFQSPYFLIIFISTPFVFFTLGLRCGILGLFVVISSIFCLILLKHYSEYKRLRDAFSFKLILSAKQIPMMYERTSKLTVFSAMPIASLFILFLLSAVFTPKSSIQGLSVPSPQASDYVIAEGKKLPSFSDYCTWAWKTLSFPYKNLNESLNMQKEVEIGDKVSVTHYTEKNGVIEPSTSVIMEYNSDFIKNQRRTVEHLEYPAIEKLMLSQGSETSIYYSTSVVGINKTKNNTLSLFLLVLSIGEPLLMYGFYTLFGQKKK